MNAHRWSLTLTIGLLAVMGMLLGLSRSGPAVADWQGNWYWKDGGWGDYAPNGLPDFDQKQDNWNNPPGSGPWTFCGPVAAANSLWWFDSKFEPLPVWPMQLPPSDHYFLVQAYIPPGPGAFDDHDPLNVGGIGPIGLVDHLACYFNTDGRITPQPTLGTEVHQMSFGLQNYLYNDPTHICYGMAAWRQGSYYDDYHVQLVKRPAWPWVVEEVQRSEDVILLLGFWQEQPIGSGHWVRVGGHYVTVAGINAADLQIALSDPFWDNAEFGGAGRVLSGTIFLPHPFGHPANLHNDAGNVSHDAYAISLNPTSPAGVWEIVGYTYPTGDFAMQNCPNEYLPNQGTWSPMGGLVMVEVEYALAMSPFKWKPGGEWVHTWWNGEWVWEWWSYEDDGHSCLPDFSWNGVEFWYDGPTALANSLWWFDSKAETLVTGGFPVPPPMITDHYPLLTAYGPWDDHAITNTAFFIGDLAGHYLNTSAQGTSAQDMQAGIAHYLAATVPADFYHQAQAAPSWGWTANAVETCSDVLLLLGVYEDVGGTWQRKGGHWVNVAGVNRDGGLIGLSDPWLDYANVDSFFDVFMGRVFPPEHLGEPFTVDEKQSPQAISHDIYAMMPSAVGGSAWGLTGYPVQQIINQVIGLNGGGAPVVNPANALQVVVEQAIGVAPYSDLSISKTASIAHAAPGQTITFTIAYTNTGLAAAENVSIVEVLPLARLGGLTYQADPPLEQELGVTFTWKLPKLTYGQHGLITVTGKALTAGPISNTVYITGQNAIGQPTPDRDMSNNAALWPDPAWSKQIDGVAWSPALTVAVETRQELVVVDVITTQHALTLTEEWVTGHLALLQYTLDPPSAGTVISQAGQLTLNVVPGQVVTLTKLFQVQPCTWMQTLIQESLFLGHLLLERRPVIVVKQPADLWITGLYTPEVFAGQPATLTLRYGNNGGLENGVWIRNEFPAQAPLLAADPPPDRADAGGLWAEWDAGDLARSQQGSITVTVGISAAVSVGDSITITDWIYDHLNQPADETRFVFRVQCRPLTGISLTVTNTAAIYTDTAVYFRADLSPDLATMPYSYSIAYDGEPGLVSGGGDDPLVFTHTFAITGAHTVTVSAWNCDMTSPVTGTVQVTVQARYTCIDLTDIMISGISMGHPGVYTWTTAYTPSNATLPITYLWDNGNTAANTTRTLGIGAYTITVTATNCVHTVVGDTHQVVIHGWEVYLPVVLRQFP